MMVIRWQKINIHCVEMRQCVSTSKSVGGLCVSVSGCGQYRGQGQRSVARSHNDGYESVWVVEWWVSLHSGKNRHKLRLTAELPLHLASGQLLAQSASMVAACPILSGRRPPPLPAQDAPTRN
eukprot:269097-Chlamydomonas_euryale.AAC.3